MPSFTKLALIASSLSAVFAAPLNNRATSSCYAANPARTGVDGCTAIDINGNVPGLM